MSKTFTVNIVSPGKAPIKGEALSVITSTSDGKIEFLANYAPAIISTIPTVTILTKEDGTKKKLFTSNGIVYIKDNILNFCCDSFNWAEEVDMNRVEEAKKRASGRLSKNDNIDIERAKRALARANARLELLK